MIERMLFAARWVMVPFYFGLIVALLVILFKFIQELHEFILKAAEMTESNAIVGAAALIDLTLVASLILIVIFSGYENFVSSIDAARHPNWPEWMTRVDRADLRHPGAEGLHGDRQIHRPGIALARDCAFDLRAVRRRLRHIGQTVLDVPQEGSGQHARGHRR
jgi:hypothetical protein